MHLGNEMEISHSQSRQSKFSFLIQMDKGRKQKISSTINHLVAQMQKTQSQFKTSSQEGFFPRSMTSQQKFIHTLKNTIPSVKAKSILIKSKQCQSSHLQFYGSSSKFYGKANQQNYKENWGREKKISQISDGNQVQNLRKSIHSIIDHVAKQKQRRRDVIKAKVRRSLDQKFQRIWKGLPKVVGHNPKQKMI